MVQEQSAQALDTIIGQGILPLFYSPDETLSKEILQSLFDAGIRAVEFTNRGADALRVFGALIAFRDASLPGMLLGIGTIKNAGQANAFADAGADFLISPGTLPDVAAVAAERGLLWVPGCMSTTEIIVAENLGCRFVKLFPGSLLGPEYVTAVKDLFPGMRFMPTGGVEVSEENIGAWFRSGVSAVGLGSKLITKAALEAGDFEKIRSLTQEAMTIVSRVR
jgi:2-dehydro-3-deoxyphosphogluconate aldolase/(4S)-4-hydroxy-2-oxoglutarate aldolase